MAYTGGEQVSYNGHLWTAQWWTEDDTPGKLMSCRFHLDLRADGSLSESLGGAAGVWVDAGACAAAAATANVAAATNVNV